MKHIFYIFFVIFCICGAAAQTPQKQADGQNNKTLIVYFTRAAVTEQAPSVDAVSSSSLNNQNGRLAGDTEFVANTIRDLTGGDLFRLETEKRYPWNYRATTDLAQTEQNQNARPALITPMQHIDAYDRIFLGYPCWWGSPPMAVLTFLESHDFTGKTIIPFCTHEGSGLGKSIADIRRSAPGATILEGLAVQKQSARRSQNAVTAWLRTLGIKN